MSKETRVPAIPNSSDPAVKALKEALEVRLGRRGNELDRAITVRELYDNGVISLKGMPAVYVGGNNPITPVNPIGDTSSPPKPTNVTANGAFVGILVSWDKPARTDLSAEIWRNNADDRTTAVLTGTASGNIYSDLVGHGETYYYWVRFVSAAGVTGPFNDIDGVQGETSEKISDIIEDLSDAIGQTHLSTALRSTINSTFRQASAPSTKADGTALVAGDVWYDTSNNNILYRFDGSSWISTQDGSFPTAADVDTKIIEQVGYCELTASTGAKSVATGLTTKTACEAATPPSGGAYSWNDSGAIAGEVKTVTSTADGHTATIQSQTNSINGLSAEQFVKVDVNGNVAGYGIYGTSTYNEFAVNADVFKIANGSSKITPFVVISGAGLTIAANGTEYGNTNQAWKDANHPNGTWFAPGTYLDTAFIADATISTAKIQNFTTDVGTITQTLFANYIDAVSIDADQINSGGSITGVKIVGGRIESGTAIMEDGNIAGAYITGGTIEGSVILSSQQAAVTEAGAPHYGYPLGVTDSKTVVSTSDSKALMSIRPYNYHQTAAPTNGVQHGSNFYRYRREDICTIAPSGYLKFYWKGVPYFWRNSGNPTTVDCFKIRARFYEGNTVMATYENQFSFGSNWHGGHAEYFNINFTLVGFNFSGTATYSRGSHEKNSSGYYDHEAPEQWVTLTMTPPAAYDFDDAYAAGIGIRLEILQSYNGHSDCTAHISHEADNDY